MKQLYVLVILFIISFATELTYAQEKEKKEKSTKQMTKFDAKKERTGVRFNIIPGPSYDPSIKFGIFVAPMLTYYPSKGDMISPASMSSVYGMYTTNNSYIVGMNNEWYLKEDTWRIRLRAGGGRLNKDLKLYDVYPGTTSPDTSVITEADASQMVFQVDGYAMRKVVKHLYAGLGFNYKKVNFVNNSDDTKVDTLLIANNLVNNFGNIGISYKTEFDSRDNVQYPYSGYYVGYTGYQYLSSGDQDNSYLSNTVDVKGFWSIKKNNRHIIATKLYGNFLGGNPSPANYSYYGRVNGDVQRGYQSGRRIDKNAINIETEYRWTTPLMDNRLRFMGLLGTGKVFGEYNSFSDAEWLPVGGLGVRYAVVPYARINVRFDTTYSKDGFMWYFGIREAF
ncbi:MAG: hypothetical protein ACPGRE_01995 [Flavobacteriaceae bacterium]